MRALLGAGVCLVALLAPGWADAEPTAKEEAPQVKVLRGEDGRITYRFKGLILYGKAHRPHAVLLLERGRDLYRAVPPGKSLTSRIQAAVRRSPF